MGRALLADSYSLTLTEYKGRKTCHAACNPYCAVRGVGENRLILCIKHYKKHRISCSLAGLQLSAVLATAQSQLTPD